MHRRFFYCFERLDVIGICVSFAFTEVLLDFALHLFGATFDVLAGVVGGVSEVPAKLSLRFRGRSFDLVLETSFIQILHRSSWSIRFFAPLTTFWSGRLRFSFSGSLNASDMPPLTSVFRASRPRVS